MMTPRRNLEDDSTWFCRTIAPLIEISYHSQRNGKTRQPDEREEARITQHSESLEKLPPDLRRTTEDAMRQSYRLWRQREDEIERTADGSKKETIIDYQNRSENLDITLLHHIHTGEQPHAKEKSLNPDFIKQLQRTAQTKQKSRDRDKGERQR